MASCKWATSAHSPSSRRESLVFYPSFSCLLDCQWLTDRKKVFSLPPPPNVWLHGVLRCLQMRQIARGANYTTANELVWTVDSWNWAHLTMPRITEDLRFWRFPLVVGRCKYHLERYPLHCNLDHKWGIFRNQKKICNNPREREREREEGDYNYFHSGEMFSIDSRARCSNKYCLTRPLPFLLELKGYK